MIRKWKIILPEYKASIMSLSIHTQKLGNAKIKVLYKSLSKKYVPLHREISISWDITLRQWLLGLPSFVRLNRSRTDKSVGWESCSFPCFLGEQGEDDGKEGKG